MQLRIRYILATAFVATAWIATVAFGFLALFRYETTPGGMGAVTKARPEGQIERAKDRPTLVMVVHPRCPCTAASLDELAQIMAQLQGKIAAYALCRNEAPKRNQTLVFGCSLADLTQIEATKICSK